MLLWRSLRQTLDYVVYSYVPSTCDQYKSDAAAAAVVTLIMCFALGFSAMVDQGVPRRHRHRSSTRSARFAAKSRTWWSESWPRSPGGTKTASDATNATSHSRTYHTHTHTHTRTPSSFTGHMPIYAVQSAAALTAVTDQEIAQF